MIDQYETTSSHRLNKEKSPIFFSKNTRVSTRDSIISIVGIRTTNSYESCLELPALVGRSRLNAFNNILDKVLGRLNNWKMKFLLKAGKQILFKSVILVIPTYSMGVFKLPKGFLQDLNKLMKGY